jgi:hypothetical protein
VVLSRSAAASAGRRKLGAPAGEAGSSEAIAAGDRMQLGLDEGLESAKIRCERPVESRPSRDVDLFHHVGFHFLGGSFMSIEVPAPEFDTEEPITVAPRSRRVPMTVRLRWTEYPAEGKAQPREEVFATIGHAEEVKSYLEAKGFHVTIG